MNKGGELKLLVSVADNGEAEAALAGGADIVDAKDPTQGALGRVSAESLRRIRIAVPSEVPLSAALGDVRCSDEVATLFDGIDIPLSFVKLGPRGINVEQARGIVTAALDCASKIPGGPGVIVVAFADLQQVDALSIRAVAALAVQAGAQGLLVDTAGKTAGSLFDFCSPEALREVRQSLPAEFTLAVAGSLSSSHLDSALHTGADIVGVRAAACEGVRTSRVSAQAVAQLVETLRRGSEARCGARPLAVSA